MARKNKATPTRRALSRRGNKDETTFSKDEIVAVKSSGKLYKAKITRVREKNHYDIEYLDFEDQYSDNISSKKLSKYLPQYDNITTLPNKAKKSLESSNITSTVVDYQEKLTFITVFSNSKHYNFICSIAGLLVLVCLIAETTESTAYGRFGNNSSIGLDPRLGWWLMELPCSSFFIYRFWIVGGPNKKEFCSRLLASIFTFHYIYRGWIFPSMIRVHNNSTNFSIIPALFSWLVTVTHAYLNSEWMSRYGKYSNKWLKDIRFIVGFLMYFVGLILIIWHDTILRNLRPCPNDVRYCIPKEGLFQYCTNAQYLSELLAWSGFALMTFGPNGLFILLVSLVNLVPRSAMTHQWYINKFGNEYEMLQRYKLVPGVW